ncbi:hypothetical protein Hanom_Chr04g00330421 [Helianthus anomalus]
MNNFGFRVCVEWRSLRKKESKKGYKGSVWIIGSPKCIRIPLLSSWNRDCRTKM